MIGPLLGAVIGHVADWDAALASRFHIHRIKPDAVSDDGLAVLEASNACPADRNVMPNYQGGGFEDFLIEIGIAVA